MDRRKILKLLSEGENQEIEEALYAIGENRFDDAVALIRPFLNHFNESIRETAAFNLGEIQDVRAIPALIQTAKTDSSNNVKTHVLYALQEYNDESIKQVILEIIKNEGHSIGVKNLAIELLADYPSKQTYQLLVGILLSDLSGHNTQFAAVDALNQMNRIAFKKDWQKIIQTVDNDYVQVIAHKALFELEKEKYLGPLDSTGLNEFELVLLVLRVSNDLDEEKEVFLFDLLFDEKINELFAYGGVSMRIFIGFILLEKASFDTVKRLKVVIGRDWSAFEKDRFENLLDGMLKLKGRYESIPIGVK